MISQSICGRIVVSDIVVVAVLLMVIGDELRRGLLFFGLDVIFSL